ncbi:MAG: hypothetical protein ACR2GZ_09085 [Solirubrobacteraceae bacterium]
MTPEPDQIAFKVERIAFAQPGRLEVSGRWYGVRGRRFMRPTLIFRPRERDGEQRVLADLEHKPWAAENGSRWTAVFALETALEDAVGLELAVAPDITVPLTADGGATKPGTRQAAKPVAATAQARSPRVRSDPIRSRPRDTSPEVTRLRERLDAAEQGITRERAKRERVDQTLEEERRGARRLRAELGRVQAELELAGAVQRELDAASATLDKLRSESREAGQRVETAEREVGEEHRTAEDLRRQLAHADAAVKRLTGAAPDRTSGSDTGVTAVSGPNPSEHGRQRPRIERVRPDRLTAERRHPVPPRSARPLNPSLRSGSWLVRGLAVVVMLIVIVAIALVIRSTVG